MACKTTWPAKQHGLQNNMACKTTWPAKQKGPAKHKCLAGSQNL
jgi:hypothetical protein